MNDKISWQEYAARIDALAIQHPSVRKRDLLEREREAFDAIVDHRLGVSFPIRRRQHLWDAYQQTIVRIRWFYKLRRMLETSLGNSLAHAYIRSLALSPIFKPLRGVVSKEELLSLFELETKKEIYH